MAEKKEKLNIKALLKNKNYVLFWFATAIAQSASTILEFVLALHVLEITGSAAQFAAILSIVALPRLFLMPFSGLLGDSMSRIKLMSILNLLVTVFLGYFFVLSKHADLSLGVIYVLVIGVEIKAVFYSAPAEAIIPDIVPGSLINEATSLSKVDDGFVWVTTPMIGALLYAHLGTGNSIGIMALMYFVAFLLQLWIKTPYALSIEEQRALEKEENFFSKLTKGARHVYHDVFLSRFLVVLPIFNAFFNATFSVAVAYLFREIYKLSAEIYGLFNSITAGVALLASIIAVPIVKKMKTQTLFPLAAFIIGGSVLLIALFSHMGLSAYISIPLSVILIGIFDCLTVVAAIPLQMSVSVFLGPMCPSKCLAGS